jgi:hypothetical protein
MLSDKSCIYTQLSSASEVNFKTNSSCSDEEKYFLIYEFLFSGNPRIVNFTGRGIVNTFSNPKQADLLLLLRLLYIHINLLLEQW